VTWQASGAEISETGSYHIDNYDWIHLAVRPLLLRHGLEALHADFNSLRSAADGCFYGAQIREKNPFIDIVCMRNGVARGRVFSAYVACFCHETLLILTLETRA
jgi:hypothetical protein